MIRPGFLGTGGRALPAQRDGALATPGGVPLPATTLVPPISQQVSIWEQPLMHIDLGTLDCQGEYQAAQRLADAAGIIQDRPMALQLRFLQTLVEVSSEKNSTTIFPVPIDLFRHFFEKPDGKKPAAHA